MRLFFPQQRIDAWSVDGAMALSGDVLSLVADGRRYRLVPAVRFLRVVAGDDARQFVGKVKASARLAASGADLVETSAVIGESAYEVQPGFLAEPLG